MTVANVVHFALAQSVPAHVDLHVNTIALFHGRFNSLYCCSWLTVIFQQQSGGQMHSLWHTG